MNLSAEAKAPEALQLTLGIVVSAAQSGLDVHMTCPRRLLAVGVNLRARDTEMNLHGVVADVSLRIESGRHGDMAGADAVIDQFQPVTQFPGREFEGPGSGQLTEGDEYGKHDSHPC